MVLVATPALFVPLWGMFRAAFRYDPPTASPPVKRGQRVTPQTESDTRAITVGEYLLHWLKRGFAAGRTPAAPAVLSLAMAERVCPRRAPSLQRAH